MAPSRDWTAIGLSVLGGVCYFLGFAGFGVWPLALVALVPLMMALERVHEDGWKRSAVLGFVFGLVTYAGGYHWLVIFLRTFSGYGWLLSTLFGTVFFVALGLQFVVFALLYRRARQRGWPAAAVTVPALLCVEWLFPLLFPTYLANAFHNRLLMIQVLDLGGPMLLSAVLALANIAVFETWCWRQGGRAQPRAIWALLTASLVATLGYGAVRLHTVTEHFDDTATLEVGIVQVNMGIFEKRQDAIEGHRRHVEQSRQLEAQHQLDLLIWPESAFVRYLPRGLPIDATRVRVDLTSPILFGGLAVEQGDSRKLVYNTAFLMGRDGFVRDTYDKIHLLAFGEYLPFGETFPSLYDLSPNSGRFERGTHTNALELGQWRIATPICYEDVLPGFMRKMVNASAPHLIVNLTNDAWFGDTQEPWIHLALAKFRAVEHRRYLVRATNSGVSAVVDPVGRVMAQAGLLEPANLVTTVRLSDQPTFYGLVGDWPAWLATAAMGVMLLRRRKLTAG